LLAGCLIVFGLLAAFHRPIFFEGTRYFILRAAKQQNLDLDYEMSGSIFTTLSVVNLKATPTEPGPIQRLEIGTINLRYSLVDMVRKGLPAFLRELDMRNVFLALAPAEPLPADKEAEPQAIKFPALFPAILNLENINVRVRGPAGDTVLEGLFFNLLPDRPGALKIQALDIPGVRRWTDIAAATTCRGRNLALTDLFVGREIALRKFNLDMTRLVDAELGVALDGTFFGAPVKAAALVTGLNAANHLKAQAAVSGLVFDSVWRYLNLPPPFQARLENLTASFEGAPGQPRDWTGEVTAKLGGLEIEKKRLGQTDLTATFAQGRAALTLTTRFDERNTLTLSASGDLPEKPGEFSRAKATGRLELNVPEAERLTFFMPEVVIGDLTVKTDFMLAGGILKTRSQIDSLEISTTEADLTETHFTLHAEKDFTLPADAPVFQKLITRLDGKVARVRVAGYEAEALELAAANDGAEVKVDYLRLAKAANRVQGSGKYVLPADLKSWDAQPLDFTATVDAPDLSAFVAPDKGAHLQGVLKAEIQASMREKKLTGSLEAEGSQIDFNGLPVRLLKVRSEIRDSHAQISELEAVLDDANHLRGGGQVQLGEGFAYQGNLDVQLKNLTILNPLLPPEVPEIGGALTIAWKGSGDAKTPQHTGTASVSITGGRWGEAKNLAANFNASYAADYINIPDFTASAGAMGDAAFSLFWNDNRLRVSNLTVRQRKTTLLNGGADLPFHLAKAQDVNALLPSNEPLTLMLRSADLDLAAVARNFGQKDPPLTGRANLTINARGTFDDLLAQAALRVTNLRSVALKDAAPADISIDLDLREDDRLRVDGTVRQKMIEPLTIKGVLPCDAAAIKARQSFDPQTPVDLTISLPRSSLDAVATLVPAIRSSRGHLAASVRVRGTIAQPDLSGDVTADLSALRFTDPNVPPINALGLRLDFTGNRVNVTRCAGVLGGGHFAASGSVVFEQLDKPVVNLTVGARNALVLQNDDMTVRASGDLRVTGPFNSALVQGTVWVTRSRFFRNIDILPIGLPGRPAPQPPGPPVVVSFRGPPLRDWKFDVAVRTLDPFLVQNNLANGRIVMDLKFGGTGLSPWVEGAVNIEQLTASLPFSRLQIANGQVFFTRQQPFLPQLNLRGASTVRDYDVAVFITGPVTAPEAVFTSDPPLPQSEVVALLATGMTTSELSSDPNAIAGRAAILLFQRAYQSVFRRNKPPQEKEDFLSRIRFDIGVTDPKTGRQATTLGIPLSENVVLMGGLDVGGNFQGQVKYLIRFK